MMIATLTMLMQPASAWWGFGNQEGDDEPAVNAVDNGAQMGSESTANLFDRGVQDNDLDSNQKKISAMNALLPISNCSTCRKVKFELYATNGCYTWQNSHPQLILMTDAQGNDLNQPGNQPQAGRCVNKVFLEAKTLKETKSIILITARDVNTGTMLKCNTKVGQIDRLDIFTRQKQFSVNSNQQMVVVGYDDEDNIFSSMDGFHFDWSITDGKDILKKFSAPDTGSRNLHHTDFFFIRSMKAGFANVAVKLEEPGYEKIALVTKKMTVVDPFIILPSEPIYILPTSEFPFTLAHIDMDSDSMNEHRPIQIPNAQYQWLTAEPWIGTMSDDGKFRSRVEEGEASILVVDQQMKNNTAEGSIYVVHPYRLEVTIRDVTDLDKLKKLHEGDNVEQVQAFSVAQDLFADMGSDTAEMNLADTHILIEEHFYKIKMYLYDQDGHKITLTDNLRFKSLNLDEKWIEVINKNNIGSELMIKTKKIAEDKVKISSQYKLDEIIPAAGTGSEKFENFANRLTQDKELIISKPVKIQHPTNMVLLPFLPSAQEAHGSGEIWNLSAKGGSGVYQWSIIDTTVATVEGSAIVKSRSLGRTQLICRDQKNFHNWDSIDIEVAMLNQLSWIEEKVEIKARPQAVQATSADGQQIETFGETRVLSLYALDSKGRKFTNCTSVRPSYEVKGDNIIRVSESYDSNSKRDKYGLIRDYVLSSENKDLLELHQRFDEQSQITFTDELKADDTTIIVYNNFGICAQQQIQGEVEGLARMRASFTVQEYANGPGRLLESEYAEVAVYNDLVSLAPIYRPYMSDLYSLNQLGQEFQSFEGFYEDWKLTLQFGSSLNWKVLGGSNFWPDQTANYRTSWTSEMLSKTGNDIFMMKQLQILTSESEFELRCVNPKEQNESQKALVTLRQSSRNSRSLLRPATHQTQVEIHCEPPKSIKLLWAQEHSHMNQPALPTSLQQASGNGGISNGENQQQHRNLRLLPRSRTIQNERTHFVLVNSRHSIRYLMLDDAGFASYNSSSVLTTVTSSDTSMAEVSMLSNAELDEQANVTRTYETDVLSGAYDKRTVQFNNLTGRMYLSAEATHYFGDYSTTEQAEEKGGFFSFGSSSSKDLASNIMQGVYKSTVNGDAYKFEHEPASSRMVIEVVRNVDVEPKFKSLYIGKHAQTYKLRIHHGSGAFSVTVNDTRLVDFIQKDREIHLTPKELGGLKIMVEDLDLPQSEVAIAEILISDIAALTLWAPRTLIEKGDDMEMVVSAYDSFMNEFDQDQYALMHFDIETETMGLRRTGGLQSTQIPDQNRNFTTIGREPGIYQLTAFTFAFQDPNRSQQANGMQHTIVSEMQRIEVFPFLEIYPNNLLITPNMRYTLQIVGGPMTAAKTQSIDGSHVEIKFAIENTNLASIDSAREVTGHEVGDTELYYEIIQLRTTQNSLNPSLSSEQDGKGFIKPLQPMSRVVSKKTVKIRVRLVTSIEIPFTHQRQIYTGSLIKMMAVLKHEDELFHHGIAPISYSWSCSEGRVLALDIPTKQELAQVHGVASNLVMTSRYVRNNSENRDQVEFFSSFNSTSIYATGEREGETVVNVLLAIEYPEKYRRDQNWHQASVTVKVMERLEINVPQYSQTNQKQTHMYLVPPHTKTKIETNKQTKLKLGYSQQSVFDYSTQQYRYQETTTPIIELINDEAIKTFDKYGKVTLLVEEGGAFSDQIVMLNVKIADVYTLSTMKSYDALSLPLGSSLSLPIHLQDDHAHKFADKIDGVGVGIYLSHPKVVHVSLDQFNQTITIQSMGSGDCNIFMFLEEHPHIFDVIRVRVSGVVQPLSPVYLHLGGEINFRMQSTDAIEKSQDSSKSGNQVVWSSGNPNILQIEPQSGKAVGEREGKADVLLSNHQNAASIVHVSKVAYGQLDQKSQLIINADNQGNIMSTAPEYRVRIKLFLEKQPDEMMPTVQFDGITLIKQNIGIRCESDNTNYVMARGEVNDLEGFFCVMSYVKGANIHGMPRFVKITATAYGQDNVGKYLYQEQVSEFEMQLISDIQVETKFMHSVELCHDVRQESIRVFSSSDFKVDFNYGTPESDGQLVLHSVTPINENTNEYNLTLQVPNQVSHSFDVSMTLSHQFASKPRVLPLHFKADTNCKKQSRQVGSQVSYEGKDSADGSYLGGYFGGTTEQQIQPQAPPVQASQGDDSAPASWMSYIIFFCALILVIVYVFLTFFQIDLQTAFDYAMGRHIGHQGANARVFGVNQRYQNQQYGRYQSNVNLSGDPSIRDSRAYRRQPLSRDQTYSSFGKDMSGQSGASKIRQGGQQDQRLQTGRFGGQQQQQRQPAPVNFDDVSLNRNNNANRSNRIDSMQDSHRYY